MGMLRIATLSCLLSATLPIHLFGNESAESGVQAELENIEIPFGGVEKTSGPEMVYETYPYEGMDGTHDALLTCVKSITNAKVFLVVKKGILSNQVNVLDPKKQMENIWKTAYDFVPGLGMNRPWIVHTASITVPLDTKFLSEWVWLGDIRFGGISDVKEDCVSPPTQEELMREEIDRFKIQRFTSPIESCDGGCGGRSGSIELDWLGDIRIGGISEVQEESASPPSQEELMREENSGVKIQRFTSPIESLDGGWSGSIEMLEVEGSGPADAGHIPKRTGNRVVVPKNENH